jgi:hypothetical protein
LLGDYPFEEAVRDANVTEIPSSVPGKFKVYCKAGDVGSLSAICESISIVLGQALNRHDKQEMWESVHIKCEQSEDGSLLVEIVVFHPDWEEPIRIASLKSRREASESNPLVFDFTHVQL